MNKTPEQIMQIIERRIEVAERILSDGTDRPVKWAAVYQELQALKKEIEEEA